MHSNAPAELTDESRENSVNATLQTPFFLSHPIFRNLNPEESIGGFYIRSAHARVKGGTQSNTPSPGWLHGSLTPMGNRTVSTAAPHGPDTREVAVLEIERARAIRDAILAMDAERSSDVVHGAEFGSWSVDGAGWCAVVANLWDIHDASCRGRMRQPNLQSNVIGYEFIEVYHEDEGVMCLVYEIDGDDEHLIYFDGGDWESLFARSDTPGAAALSQAA